MHNFPGIDVLTYPGVNLLIYVMQNKHISNRLLKTSAVGPNWPQPSVGGRRCHDLAQASF